MRSRHIFIDGCIYGNGDLPGRAAMKNKPEPIPITTGNGTVINVTPTERGLLIELDDNWRLVYTSIVSDHVRAIRFEVEARWRKGKETRPL